MITVNVSTGARLHFGLICGSASTGWVFGGIGLMLRTPSWRIRLSRQRSSATGENEDLIDSPLMLDVRLIEKIHEILGTLRDGHTDAGRFRVEVLQQIPRHAGFGSGTQLALALAAGIQSLLGPQVQQPTDETARSLQRAQRSSIGTKGFERGGFLIDFGKPTETESGRRFERIEIPEHWRFVTIRPAEQSGLCGESERQYFDRGLTMPPNLVSTMAEQIEQRLRPALLAGDHAVFARALGEYGRLAGEFYAQEQGGIFTIPEMSDLAEVLRREGYPGTSQSSWGPTVCVPCASFDDAQQVHAIAMRFADERTLNWIVEINEPLNQGALIRMSAPDERRVV